MKHSIAITWAAVALATFAITPGGSTYAQSSEKPSKLVAAPDDAVENCCYLGVSTSIAPPMLREQLNLPPGIGIVIDDIDPSSPANQAGLQVHDVIEQLNDQWIINVQQFSVLVRMQKPGDAIHLKVIRHGQPTDVKIALAEKELPVLEDAPTWLRGGPMPIPRAGTGRVTGIVTRSDSTSTITIIAREDDRQVIIRDRQGKTLFDGPLNSTDDHAKIPAQFRDKVQRIEQGSAEHFRELRNAMHPTDPPTTGE